MFILNLSKNKLIAIISLVGTAVILLCFWCSGFFQPAEPANDLFTIGDTEQQRRTFIESYGVALSPAEPVIEKADIPEEFDESFKEYELLQNEMGLSLYDYRGKTLTKYTYEMTNHPQSYLMPVYVNLLMDRGIVAAADICAPNLKDGFLQSLAFFE